MLIRKKPQPKYCADAVQTEFKKSQCFLKNKYTVSEKVAKITRLYPKF